MFRKHLGWYIEQAPWPADPLQRRAAKSSLCRLETPAAVEAALAEALDAGAQGGEDPSVLAAVLYTSAGLPASPFSARLAE